MKHEPRSRRSGVLSRIAAAAIFAAAPAAFAASGISSIQVRPVGATANIGIGSGYPPDAVRVRYALVQSPDATDALTEGDTVIVVASGGANNGLRLGAAPGLRVVRYCYETSTTNCDPANGGEYFHIGGVAATCTLTAPNTTGNVPLDVAATAQCNVQTGAGVVFTGGNFNWSLPAGVSALPPTNPTAPAAASFTLATPGNYNLGIAPQLDFSVVRGAPFNTTDPAGAIVAPASNLPLQATAPANQAPVAALTAPADNAQFGDASTIPVRADASDPDGTIAQVQFLLDGSPIGADATAPYTLDWRVNATPGTHVLVARATDNQGAIGESTPVRINVVRQVQAIDVLTPYENLKFLPGGDMEVRLAVRGGLGVAPDVELDWTVTGGATSAAGTCTANDTPNRGLLRTDANGQAVVRFVASCADNARTLVATTRTTPPVSATVRLRGPHDALILLVAPREGASYDEADAFDLRASLNDPDSRVRQVEFTANGELIGTDASAPYAMQWPANKPPGTYRIAVRGREATGLLIEGSGVNVTITRRAGSLHILTAGNALGFTPGQPVTVRVRAASPQGPAANQQLAFAIENAAPAPAPAASRPAQRSAAQATAAACAPNDSPAQGVVTTDANGEADITFTAGCNSGSRQLTVTSALDPSVSASVTLRGPDANVTSLRPGIDARAIVARPGEPTPVPVAVSSDTGQPLAGATLEFTLQPATAGTITATATADAQGRASATLVLGSGDAAASVRICVSGRPDLCADVPVRNATLAVIQPAAELAAPLLRQSVDSARVQLGQVRSHLATTRSASGHGFSGGLNLRTSDGAVPLGGGTPDDGDDSRYRFFLSGDVDVGERDSRGRQRNGFKVTTRGVTAGVDYRFAPDFVAGAALGAMRGTTDLANGGSQDASGTSFSVFAQWLPTERWYLNAIVNVGRNAYDIERRLYDGSRLDSDTASRQRAAQFEAGYSFGRNALKFTPFLRYEFVRADLDAIRESGDSLDALDIGATRVKASTLSGGAYLEYAFSARNGVWIPSLRVEYFGENRDQEALFARLIAGNAGPFRVPEDDVDDNYGTVGLSLQWIAGARGQPVSSFISIDRGFGRDDYETTRYAIGIKIPF